MTDAMAHRGPYDRGTHLGPNVGIGARRLPLVDVKGGHQPFSNETGEVWAALNGMLFNHNELRDDLASEGHSFKSRCDTEVIPHLYEHFGTAFPEQLRGEFAIVTWDGPRRRLVLVRDRVGAKPLYYAEVGDLLVFASELKSLLASGLVGGELDYEAIDAYLTFGYFPGPSTPLASVAKLLPGHRLVVDTSGVSLEQYWAWPQPATDAPRLCDEEYVEELVERVEESVSLRLMSDVPLGAMLSGGLDSSFVVGLMARNMSEPVKTFSVGFAEAGAANELADARQVADLFGTDHHELELSFVDDTVELEQLVWHLDEPICDLSSLGLLALSEFAASEITVALSGMGPDEILGGYSAHRNAAIAERWGRLPSPLRRLGAGIASRGPSKLRRAATVLSADGPVDRFVAQAKGNLSGGIPRSALRGALAAGDGGAARRAAAKRLDGFRGDPVSGLIHLDCQLSMVDDMLQYVDRASMARAIDLRAPILDHKVVEFCADVPVSLKVRGGTTKYLLKRAARGLVPDRIIDKPKIGFFYSAVDQWFRAQTTRAIATFLLQPNPKYADLIDRSFVDELVRRNAQGTDRGAPHLLLSILMLEIWLSSYLPRALRGESPERDVIRLSA